MSTVVLVAGRSFAAGAVVCIVADGALVASALDEALGVDALLIAQRTVTIDANVR